MDATAAVLTGPRRIELERFAIPEQIGDDEALLAVEATGMCGTDWEQYLGNLAPMVPFPVIPGHETVGRIAAIGATAAARWGLDVGARVAVESTRPCLSCAPCLAGRWLYCDQRVIYGLTTTTDAPSLSGGFGEYLVLRSNSRVYPLPEDLSTEDAVFFNPLGAGFDWAVRIAGTVAGDAVVVFGPGQRGLACVVAAKEVGAEVIVMVGRGRRPWKLELARSLGATHLVDSSSESVVDAVEEATGGRMADRVVDTTPGAIQPVLDALAVARSEGTVVLAANKRETAGSGDVLDPVLRKALTVRGAYSVSEWAKLRAIEALASHRYDLSAIHTHTMGLAELDVALRTLGGEVEGEDALHITVTGLARLTARRP